VLADKLRDHASRLDELDVGEADANLRSVFSWTYDALTPDAASLFTLLGLVPGLDISLSAAASLAALPEARADALLRELETAHLVQQPVPDRYRMHDLVHLYAAEQARRQPERTREAALRRLVDFYLHTARSADLLQNSQRPTITVDPPAPRCHPRSLSTVPAALTWMSTERLNLLAAQQLAADHQWHVPVWGLAWYMRTFLWRQGYLHDNLVTWRTAIGAADHIGDTAVRNLAHRHLGDAHLLLRQHATTFMHHQYALILAENAHDIPNQAHTHWGLAWAANERGNHQRALHHATQALRLYTTLDQPRREADALTTIGQCHIGLGNYHQAREYCRQAFTIFREHHHRIGEARTLDSLGLIELRAGQPIHAVDHYQHAIALFREFGFTYYEANALEKLGETHTALDQHHHAHIVWTRALALYETQHRTADAQRIRHHMRST
jgi:tetratricopeptide (TPR) repeat protein